MTLRSFVWMLRLAFIIGVTGFNAMGAETAIATIEPRGIMETIYNDAVHGERLDWLGTCQRRKYLSKSLTALWARFDAKKPPYGDSRPLDWDLTADTNGADLRTFIITVPEQTANKATVYVQLGYSVPSPDGEHIVIYDFLRENGRWKVNEIRTKAWSARALLSNWVKQR